MMQRWPLCEESVGDYPREVAASGYSKGSGRTGPVEGSRTTVALLPGDGVAVVGASLPTVEPQQDSRLGRAASVGQDVFDAPIDVKPRDSQRGQRLVRAWVTS